MIKQFLLDNKKLIIIIVSAVVSLAILGTSLYLLIPVGLKIDKSSLLKIDGNVQVYQAGEHGRYISLGKTDADGQLTDDPFKIISFTDLHLDTYKAKGGKTIANMVKAIKAEQPDLVIFTGDIVTSSNNMLRVKQFAEIMEELGVYWCPVLGNHEGDNGRSITRAKFIEVWSGYEHCLAHDDPEALANDVWGNGNYVINIVKSGGIISQSLIFIDSGDRISKQDAKQYGVNGGYDYIKHSQIDWYKGVIDNLNAIEQDEPISSLLYFHIPLKEYETAYDTVESERLKIGETSADGNTKYISGYKYEDVCCAKYNNGFFDVIKEKGSTKAIFCGHDHINNFDIQYFGIHLVYNQKTGYSSYDLASKKLGKPNQGYTKTFINSDGSAGFTHHIFD